MKKLLFLSILLTVFLVAGISFAGPEVFRSGANVLVDPVNGVGVGSRDYNDNRYIETRGASSTETTAQTRDDVWLSPASIPYIKLLGGTATEVVAASDSIHKDKADYICDGTADQIQINAALADGNVTVVLLNGHYSLDRTTDHYSVGVPSDITLIMASNAILTLADSQNCTIIANKDGQGAGNENIKIIGGTLDGNKNNQATFTPTGDDLPDKTGGGIYFKNCSKSLIHNVTIHDTRYHGIMLATASYNTVSDCRIYDFSVLDATYLSTSGVCVFSSSNGNIIKNNEIYNTLSLDSIATNWRGLYLSMNSDYNQLINNYIYEGKSGIRCAMSGCDFNIFNENLIYNMDAYGIKASAEASNNATYNKYNDNSMDNVKNGIATEYNDHSQINNNNINSAGSSYSEAIKTIDCTDMIINNNNLVGWKIIDLYSSTGVTMIGNRGDGNIRLYDGSDDVIMMGNNATGIDLIGTKHIIAHNQGFAIPDVLATIDFAFTSEGDITDPLTGSIVLLDGDNDANNDTIDLQNGSELGQVLHLVASADIDADDTCTINMADTTCTNCPAIVFDKIGENAHLVWTGSTWICVSLQDAL